VRLNCLRRLAMSDDWDFSEGLPKYGIRWNVAVPMADGYWTPRHLAGQEIARLNMDEHTYQELASALEDDSIWEEEAPVPTE